MKWDIQKLEIEIRKLMSIYGLSEFPTRQFLESIGRSDLFNAIARLGGFRKVAKDMNILPRSHTYRNKWSDKDIEKELKKFILKYGYERMPSKPEILEKGRNDLGSALTNHHNMKYWAEKLGLEIKDSETKTGREYEDRVIKKLVHLGYEVEDMSVKHPYDLLVNGTVKVDVKAGMVHNHFGPRAHTFALNKKHPTCDIYVCVALDEQGITEKIFIIPSKFVRIVTLNIGTESKYNVFINRWDYVKYFSDFYMSVI